ncbi:hypothetical protein [Streptomyces sp. NPDC006784]|uniref:hypothetical protein n=1 Tax=Streptomyces sp. NPDC006784 TaxID=3364764 RepID=UPI0036906822
MDMKQLALAEAALKTLGDAVKDQLAEVREQMQTHLDDTGASRVDATLPDGTKVATVSRSESKPKAVVIDEATLLAWVREHAPDEITSRVVTEIRPAYMTALLARLTAAGAAEVPDEETGEIREVPGVEMRTSRVTTHTVRAAKGGAEAIVAAWRSGQLAHLDLPQLTAGGEAA